MDRIYNFNAEANVIGSILMESDSICQIIVFLDHEDFYNLKHKIIYKNLKKMYEENLAVDIVTLLRESQDADVGTTRLKWSPEFQRIYL